jgi:hypothetical protein
VSSIIFVHGLQGHPRKTWACDGTQGLGEATGRSQRGLKKLFSMKRRTGPEDPHKLEPDNVFWPLDLLPKDCGNSRVLTWGYDSKVSNFFGGAASQSNIRAHAQNLLHALKIQRLDCVSSSTNEVYGYLLSSIHSNEDKLLLLHIPLVVSSFVTHKM